MADRPPYFLAIPLKRKECYDPSFILHNSDLHVVADRRNNSGELRMKKWAYKIGVLPLQLRPDSHEVIAEFPTGNKCDFHWHRNACFRKSLSSDMAQFFLLRHPASEGCAVVEGRDKKQLVWTH